MFNYRPNALPIACVKCLAACFGRASSQSSYVTQCGASLTAPHSNAASSNTSVHKRQRARQPDEQVVALWQHVAGLTAEQAQQLLLEQPKLSNFLQSGFSSRTFALNLHLLRCHGASINIGAGVPPKLRAYLAVAPHHTLEQAKQVAQLFAGQTMQHISVSQQTAQQTDVLEQLTAHLEGLVAHAGHRRHVIQHQPQSQPPQQKAPHKREQQQNLHPPGPQQQQQHLATVLHLLSKKKLRALLSNDVHLQQHVDEKLLLLSQAVAQSLRLSPEDQLPSDLARMVKDRSSSRGTQQLTAANASDSSKTESYKQASSKKQQNWSVFSALCTVLSNTARGVLLRAKPTPGPKHAAALVAHIQRHSGMDSWEVLKLVLSRPKLLWAQSSPGLMLQRLQQQLPELSVKQLLQHAPGVLALSETEVNDVVSLLLHRLALAPEQAAKVVQRHPQVLLNGAKAASLNLGFLVGLGLRPVELQAMLLKSPTWLTRPLKDLTMQWQFVTTVAKASSSDVVLLPELLSLPISRLGPRILYARKRQVKLLLPSHAAMLPVLSPNEWLKHKLVPLQFWTTATDKRMCDAVGLSVEDYGRFKTAWARVDAFSWSHASGNR